MSAVINEKAISPAIAKEQLQPPHPLLAQFDALSRAPGGVARLRELIVSLALQGKLVAQDKADEPAEVLLERIRLEKINFTVGGRPKSTKPVALETNNFLTELPLGWVWTNLATIGRINPRNDASDDMPTSFVQMSSIPTAFSDQHASETRPWRDIKTGFTHFAEGDVGIAKITPCFENAKSTVFTNLVNGIGSGTTELHIVRPLGGICTRYVLLFLKSPTFLREGEAVMTGSAGQKRLPRSYFENKPFPLPPLAEQSRIVARIDELMRLCDALEAKGRLEAEQHARLLDALLSALTDSTTPDELEANWQRVAGHFDLLLDRPAAVDALERTILQLAVRGVLVPQGNAAESASDLVEKIRSEKHLQCAISKAKRTKAKSSLAEPEPLFELPASWAWCSLADIALQGPTNGLSPKPSENPTTVRCLSLSATTQGYFRADCFKYVDVPLDTAEPFLLKTGDLLIQRGNSLDYVGIAALYDGIDNEFMYPDLMMRVQLSPLVDARYVHIWLISKNGREYFQKNATGTQGTMPKVNQSTVAGTPIPLPPMAEQKQIVARVDQLRAVCADLRQRLLSQRTTQAQLAEALVEQAAA